MPFRWRPDGDYIANLPHTRRVMPFIMRSRNESAVYYEQHLDVEKTWDFIERASTEFGMKVTILHVLVWRAAQVLHLRPGLNRFVAGRRIYQRRGVWITFSIKKAMTTASPDLMVKLKVDPAWSLQEVVERVHKFINTSRSDTKSFTDTEMSILFKLPTMVVDFFASLLMRFDHLGLLPGFMLKEDEMYASLAIANLGSIGLEPAYHHLYEYGNIPIFAAVGKKSPRMVVDEIGRPAVRDIMTIRYTFDERIHDGFYGIQALELFKHLVENPEEQVDLTAAQ